MNKSCSNQRHQPWKILDRKKLISAPPWLTLSVEKVRVSDGRIIDDFYHLDVPDFVVVCAETPSSEVLMLRQYKHAVGRASLTLPGGQVEPNEEPGQAARRELLEETGYLAEDWSHLGSYTVNGNLGCGRGHFYKAEGACPVQNPDSGDLEEMDLLLMDHQALEMAMESGEIILLNHAAAISMAMRTPYELAV